MKDIRFETQQKEGKKYITKYTNTDREEVYRSLCADLINKKLVGSSSITRIERKRHCGDTQKIIVTYDNGWRTVYEVEDRI